MSNCSALQEVVKEHRISIDRTSIRFDFCDLCNGLTADIPEKIFNLEQGLLNQRVVLTCLSSNADRIVIGSNIGVIYVFDRHFRRKFTIQGKDKICSLKLCNNMEYPVLGVGLGTGMFVVVQLPLSEDDQKSKKLLQKNLTDIHRCSITCVEWSSDGRKVFTGDASGLIMMTLVDFPNDVFEPTFVYCNSSTIIQLTYWGNFLAAATADQTALIDIADDCKVRNIGSKNKSGRGGVAFIGGDFDESPSMSCPNLFLSRSKCRLWRADVSRRDSDDVKILETQDYRNLISSTAEFPVPVELQSQDNTQGTFEFGQLHSFLYDDCRLAISYDKSRLFIVDLKSKSLIGWANFQFAILDVAVCSALKEILILFDKSAGDPYILRISPLPADPWLTRKLGESRRLSAKFLQQKESGVKDLLTKLKMTATAQIAQKIGQDSDSRRFQVAVTPAQPLDTLDTYDSSSTTPETMSVASNDTPANWLPDEQQVVEHVVVKRRSRAKVAVSKPDRPDHFVEEWKSNETSSKQEEAQQQLVVDRLTTPTQEQYLTNRFNPFDDGTNEEKSRQDLELLLDHALLPAKLAQDAETVEQIPTEPVVQITEDTEVHEAPEIIYTTMVSPAKLSKSFRELLVGEALAAAADLEAIDAMASVILSEGSRESSCSECYDEPEYENGTREPIGRDTWCEVKFTNSILYIGGCRQYFCCVNIRQRCQYFSYVENGVTPGDLLPKCTSSSDAWSSVGEKTDAIAVSSNGRILWRIADQVAYALQKPGVHTPSGRKWCEAAKDASTIVAVSNSAAWYVKTDGKICAQVGLRPDRPCYKIHQIYCEWPVAQLACTDDVVWALRHDGRILVRIGIKFSDCPLGTDWIDFVPDGPSEVVAISLSSDETAWIVDSNGRLWFCRGVNGRYPIGRDSRWWQVALPSALIAHADASKATRLNLPHAVCATPVSLHLAVDHSLWFCRGSLTGHRWIRPVPSEYQNVAFFKHLCIPNLLNENSDCIIVIRPNGDFMAFQPQTRRLACVCSPHTQAKLAAISGASGYVWVLDDAGRIFICNRLMISDNLGWQQMDFSQFADEDLKFVHISCTVHGVWAVDESGHVYVRMGLTPTDDRGFPLVWALLDDDQNSSVSYHICQLVCSADGLTICALTKAGQMLVRTGITYDMPIGDGWTIIDDLKVQSATVGKNCIWVLSESYELYQRHGISPENPAGNYWKMLPFHLNSIAATIDGKLWGLDNEDRLVKHQTILYEHATNNDSRSRSKVGSGPTATSDDSDLQDFEFI